MHCAKKSYLSNVERAADRGICFKPIRSADQRSRKFFSKDNHISAPNFRNWEQRFVVLTLSEAELDTSCNVLVPVVSPVEVPNQNSLVRSSTTLDVQTLQSLSPSVVIFFQLDLNEDPKTGADERVNNTIKSSAVINSLKENEVEKSLGPSPKSICKSDNSTGSLSDCSDPTLSDFFDTIATTEAGKPSKRRPRSSRKKAKKKKRQQQKKLKGKSSIVLGTQCDDKNFSSCGLETTSTDEGACSEENYAQNNSCEIVDIPSLTGEDVTISKDENDETSDDYLNRSATPTTCRSCSYSDLLEDAESLSPQGCTGFCFEADVSFSHPSNMIPSTGSPEVFQSNGDDDALSSCPENKIQPSFCSSIPHLGNETALEGDNGADLHSGFKAENSCNSDCSFSSISTETLSDADNSFERVQCSSQASSSSDDFHTVVYRKRGRLNRKFAGNVDGIHKYNGELVDCHRKQDFSFSAHQKVQNKLPGLLRGKRDSIIVDSQGFDTSSRSCKLVRNTDKHLQFQERSNKIDDDDDDGQRLSGRIYENPEKIYPEKFESESLSCDTISIGGLSEFNLSQEKTEIPLNLDRDSPVIVKADTIPFSTCIGYGSAESPKFGSTHLTCRESCFICDFSHGSHNNRSDLKSNFEVANASGKILSAVIFSHNKRNASNNVHFMSRNVVEIEEFLLSASPILNQKHERSKSCSRCHVIHESVLRNTNLKFSELWKWFEKPGTYGLEVKIDRHAYHYSGAQNDSSKIRAYFVPYLSAIQLFRRSKSTYTFPTGPAIDPSYHLIDNEELLFEYFESEQPQLRKPFFEKMKDIINGKAPNNQTYGDSSILGCLSLCEVHPASWYSVAWYPIYQIPEGNFRASFLTYHSLGIFTSEDAPLISSHSPYQIISPVVGLQSYNAEGESWFKMPEFIANMEGKAGLGPTPSEITKEWFVALDKAASAMSRATVLKGVGTAAAAAVKVVNRHPDFEFFHSRRRR